jgi:hypothetical protein
MSIPRSRWIIWLAAALFSLLLYLLLITYVPFFVEFGADAAQYRAIASGAIATVVQPFTSRAIFALGAGVIANLGGWELKYGFTILAWLSLLIFLVGMALVLARSRVLPRHWLWLVAATPFFFRTFGSVEMPDATAAAATMAAFAALATDNLLAATLLCAAAVTLRETGVILLLFALGESLRQRRWDAAMLGAAAGCAALLLNQHLSALGLGNVRHLPAALYMLLKIPANFFPQVLGIDFWTEAVGVHCAPVWFVVHPPRFLSFGGTDPVMVCEPSAAAPLRNLFTLCTTFGVLPSMLLAAALRLRGQDHDVRSRSTWLRIAIWYGLLMLLLGVVTGRAVPRLVSYGWPAFVLAAPVFASRQGILMTGSSLCLHLGTCITGIALSDLEVGSEIPPAALAVFALALQVCACMIFFRVESQPKTGHVVLPPC